MPLFKVENWDDAYANAPNIPNGDAWPGAWVAPAAAFRDQIKDRAELSVPYGDNPREVFDLFHSEGPSKGLIVFVHGGFWLRLDKSYWSHLAAGPLAHGWTVAMPSYPLAPEKRVRDIVNSVARAIDEVASRTEGPIRLVGHSVGGHMVTRVIAEGTRLSKKTLDRIEHVFSISGVHDLRPLVNTTMNDTIGLDAEEATSESPALLTPLVDVPVTCWVGANERSEFVRQNALLANVWRGLGLQTQAVEEPDRHHFDVIDGLADQDSVLMKALLAK